MLTFQAPSTDFVWVEIDRFEGSSPRERGAWMCVTQLDLQGSIGGGHLEFEAIARARKILTQPDTEACEPELHRYALGPSLGQCCGGVVWLKFQKILHSDAIKKEAVPAHSTSVLSQNDLKIALFGGGHVGRAIVQQLTHLPCQVHWLDSRDEIFPGDLAGNIQAENSSPIHHAVRSIAAGSLVLIMSFSHAEDLDIVMECLLRQREQTDLPFIGLIGSKTKWATFRARLRERGFSEADLAHITCPIGIAGVIGKEPEVIAAAVAAQLLQHRKI